MELGFAMDLMDAPVFCLTSDADWASDDALHDFITVVSDFKVRPTIFATNASSVLDKFAASGDIEVGIHPNFLPASSHGDNDQAVIDHMCRLFPNAQTFRAHCFADSSHIAREFYRRGFRYDSNLCLYMQPRLVPFRHCSGLTRFPVYFEDDVHWTLSLGDWDINRYLDAFLSPGLKILNFHPFMVYTNVPDEEFYLKIKRHIPSVDERSVAEIRYRGNGTRTFMIALLKELRARDVRFATLSELYKAYPVNQFLTPDKTESGRHTVHSDDEYRRYWSMSDAERQAFLRDSYGKRSATDPYATSRDFNMRELEIDAIASQLSDPGPVLDLGCGNGYTLLSLAKRLPNWEMLGIDFSEHLLEGASALQNAMSKELRSQPLFQHADAVEFVKSARAESYRYVITERFLQNLPNTVLQKEVMAHIHRILVPGGRFLMLEGSDDGFESLNDVREKVGLNRIPATSADNVSALRFEDKEIEQYATSEVNFHLANKLGLSLYFIISRVIHPLLVAPSTPTFDAKINKLARLVQQATGYTPGYGSNVLWVLDKGHR